MSRKEMTKEDIAGNIEFYSSLSIETLQSMISQMEAEISGLGEMSESAQNGADWMRFGPSWQDCENEIEDTQQYLDIAKAVLETKMKEKELENIDSENHTSKCDNTSECSDR